MDDIIYVTPHIFSRKIVNYDLSGLKYIFQLIFSVRKQVFTIGKASTPHIFVYYK